MAVPITKMDVERDCLIAHKPKSILEEAGSDITRYFSSLKDNEKGVYFTQQLNEKYLCAICKNLLQEPFQNADGDLFCKTCKEMKRVENSFPDKSVFREISNLECYCENYKSGCVWKGAFADINNHESDCKFKQIKCDKCNESIAMSNLDEHKKKDCVARASFCSYCGEEYAFLDEQLHIEKCLEVPFECPYACGTKPQRSKLFEHINKCEKILSEKVCPYSVVGCKYDPDKDTENLREHMEKKSMLHAAFAIEKLVLFQGKYDQLMKEKQKLSSTIEEYEKLILHLQQQLNMYKVQVDALSSINFEEFKTTQKKVEEEVKNLHTKIEEIIKNQPEKDYLTDISRNLQEVSDMKSVKEKTKEHQQFKGYESSLKGSKTKMEVIETNLAVSNSNLLDLDLRLSLLETTAYDGRIRWRVENVRHRMRLSESGRISAIHSPPCFVTRFGYKFCTRLYMNGDGMGKNTHLSIFFVLMRSQHDTLLDWPFVKRVTFRLINPTNPALSKHETFLTDRNSSSFKKPTKELNIAAGCPMFIEKSFVLENGFISDDCLFVETSVEDEKPMAGK